MYSYNSVRQCHRNGVQVLKWSGSEPQIAEYSTLVAYLIPHNGGGGWMITVH